MNVRWTFKRVNPKGRDAPKSVKNGTLIELLSGLNLNTTVKQFQTIGVEDLQPGEFVTFRILG
jgi:hypothetical protein